MRKTSDSNGRTVWFQGEAGTLAPKLKAKKVGNASVCAGRQIQFYFCLSGKGIRDKEEEEGDKERKSREGRGTDNSNATLIAILHIFPLNPG